MTPALSALVGRDQPLAELRALVEAALGSRGGVVTLTGEAGIGKTTLATAAADHAEARGATVVWGTCWEGAPPFWPWLEVLAALGVEAGLQDAGQGRWRIDLSVWLRDLHAHVAGWHTRLRDTITDQQRLAVLRIKDVWHRLPSYPDQVSGWEIYTAVLEDGVRTPEQFARWLTANGFPSPDPAALGTHAR